MKKLLILLTLIANIIQADDIPDPDKYKAITNNVSIININAYPSYTIVLCKLATPGSPIENHNCSLIQDNQTLEGGYHGSNQLFAFSKELFEDAGEIDNIDFQGLSQAKELAFIPFLWKAYNLKERPESGNSYYYEITSITDDNMTIELKKRVVTFNDGSADKTITY